MLYQNNKIVAVSLASNSGTCQDVYSTEEQVIGRWINGKPLYRRVIESPSPSQVNTWFYPLDIPDFDDGISIRGIIGGCSGMMDTYSIPNKDVSVKFINTSHGRVGVTTTSVTYTGRDRMLLIVEYTKTTDEATIQSTFLEKSQFAFESTSEIISSSSVTEDNIEVDAQINEEKT